LKDAAASPSFKVLRDEILKRLKSIQRFIMKKMKA